MRTKKSWLQNDAKGEENKIYILVRRSLKMKPLKLELKQNNWSEEGKFKWTRWWEQRKIVDEPNAWPVQTETWWTSEKHQWQTLQVYILPWNLQMHTNKVVDHVQWLTIMFCPLATAVVMQFSIHLDLWRSITGDASFLTAFKQSCLQTISVLCALCPNLCCGLQTWPFPPGAEAQWLDPWGR